MKKYKINKRKSISPIRIVFIFALFSLILSLGYALMNDIIQINGTANIGSFSISYNLDGGTNVQNPITEYYATSNAILPIPNKNNYTFGGWYENDSFTGNSITTTPTGSSVRNLNLYAKWVSSGGQSGSGTIADPYINTDNEYSDDDLQEGITQFVNADGKPQVTADENGQVIGFEFTDTGTDGLLYTTGDTLDTGIVAFDNRPFTIHIKFTITPDDNRGKYIFSALQSVGNNKYGGFIFYCYDSSTFFLNASSSASITSAYFGSRINTSGFKVNSTRQTFTLDFTYTPAPTKKADMTFTPVRAGQDTFSKTSAYFPDSLSDATISIGGTGFVNDSSKDPVNMVILEFSVYKQ